MVMNIQRTHESYWADFDVAVDDLDVIYNMLLEREAPLTTDEMISRLTEHRLEKLEQEKSRSKKPEHTVYLPSGEFKAGVMLVFPALNNVSGKVTGVRTGSNPELGVFQVIEVELDGIPEKREFAAKLDDHPLNQVPEPEEDQSPAEMVAAILDQYGDEMCQRLEAALEQEPDIVRIAGRWFPKALLADINQGHINIAEAVLDVAKGGPLPTSSLVEHVELPKGLDPLLAEFSMDYTLQEDERFDEVGPAGQVLWYLKRLEPPEVQFPPVRLEYDPIPYERSILTEELLKLEQELEDEFAEQEAPSGDIQEVTLSILFPHWRVGALPLSRRLQTLFPTAYESPRIRFILVDGHSGDTFPGWVVRAEGYVFGLDDWYRQYDIPAGGLIRVKKAPEPGKVIIESTDRRKRSDWIRTASVYDNDKIGFTMLKQPVGAAYDDLMVVGLLDPAGLDEVWLRGEQRSQPLDRLVAHVFRELAKLNPQSAVHAKTLYSGVNVLRRIPPGPLFAELVTRPYYTHVGDSYWRFDDAAWR